MGISAWMGDALSLFASIVAVGLAANHVEGETENTRGEEQPLSTDAGATTNSTSDESRVPLMFSGGYETDPGGRPVALIAGALRVPPDVFREAFRDVRPARGGEAPTGASS